MKLVGEGELMTCFVDHFATEFNLYLNFLGSQTPDCLEYAVESHSLKDASGVC